MDYEVVPALKAADGSYEGVIIGVEHRTVPYKYTDFVIEFEKGMRINYGCPSVVSETSRLGKLFSAFGIDLKVGKTVSDAELIGRRVCFVLLNAKRGDKEYLNVVPGSVKPAPTEQVESETV